MSQLIRSKYDPKDGLSFRWELVIHFTDGGFIELHRYYIMPGHGEPKSIGGLCTVEFVRQPDDIVFNQYVCRAETEPLDRALALPALMVLLADKPKKWDVWHIIRDSEEENL